MFADLLEAGQGNQGPPLAHCAPDDTLLIQRKIFEYIKYLQQDIVDRLVAGLI